MGLDGSLYEANKICQGDYVGREIVPLNDSTVNW